MEAEDDRQRVWPVFALAAATAVFGSWLALTTPASEARVAEPIDPLRSVLTELATTPLDEAVRLRLDTGERRIRARIEQVRGRDEAELRTAVGLIVVESAADVVGDVLTYERGFEDVRVEVRADGEPVATSVTGDVERLLATARHRVRVRSTGETIEAEVVSAEAAQLRHLIEVVEQAIDLAQPRLPREAVRQHEPWTWSVVGAPALRGKTTVTAQVVGVADEGVVIELAVDTDATWQVQTEGEEPHVVAVRGAGEGRAVWRPDGGLLRSQLRWAAHDGSSSVAVDLERE